jgi:hypothetical protein
MGVSFFCVFEVGSWALIFGAGETVSQLGQQTKVRGCSINTVAVFVMTVR